MKNSDFRKRLGLQFFAEADTGGAGAEAGAELGGVEDDFLAAFDMDGGEPATEDGDAAEAQVADDGVEAELGTEGGGRTAAKHGGEQAADNPQDTTAEQAEALAAPAVVALEIGGQTVQVPADAMQALTGALGRDVSVLIAAGMATETRQSREMRVLDAYAKAAGVTTEDYIAFLEREQEVHAVSAEVDAIRAQYPEGTPDEALRVIAERNVADRRAQEAQAEAARQEQLQRAQNDAAMQPMIHAMQEFTAVHPEIKGAQDVPQGVWDLVRDQRLSLPVAYERYQTEQARAELEQTRQQLKAAQKMNGNRTQAVGSMSGSPDGGRDEFASILLS